MDRIASSILRHRTCKTNTAWKASKELEQGGKIMKGKYLRRLGGLILAALLLPGVVTLLSNSTAQAQRRIIVVQRPIYRPFYRPWGWGYGPWGYDPYFDYYRRYGHYV